MSERRAPFALAGQSIAAGSRATIDIPVAQLYTHTPLSMPAHVVHGRRDGPVLMVCAAIHGDEINGVEIIRRLLKLQAMYRLRGTLIAVPIVNVFGFIDRSRYLPDRRDLNRSFPGSEQGSLAGRIAHLVKTELVDHCTHVIDLHTAALHRANLPQLRVNLTDPGSEELAKAFGIPVVMHSDLIEGSLRHTCDAQKVPVITYEAGEALRFDESGIKAGLNGIVRVMRHLGMLSQRKREKPVREPFVANSSSWVRAPQDGIFRAAAALGARVRTGQPMGWIADPFGEREVVVEAPFNGLVVGRATLPLVHEGEALFNVARFDAVGTVARTVEAFQEQLEQVDEPMFSEPPIV